MIISIKKKTLLAISIFLFSMLLIGASSTISSSQQTFTFKGVNSNSMFTKLISSESGISQGTAIFEINNPFNKLNLSKSLYFSSYLAEGSPIDSYDFYVQKNTTIEIPNYTTENYNDTCSSMNNQTRLNESYSCVKNRQIQNGTLSQVSTEWVKTDVISKGVYKIKFVANWKAHLGPQNIDWYPGFNFNKQDYNLPQNIAFLKTEWAWWNSSWSNYKPILINETSGSTLSNYSLLIYVPYSANMKTDFSDLRFISSDNTTELGYYFKNTSASTYAYVWVNIPTLTASSTNNLIYMYYGNSGVSTTASGYKTFIRGFDDASVDNSSQWQMKNEFGGSGSIAWDSAGYYNLTQGTTNAWGMVVLPNNMSSPATIYVEEKLPATAGNQQGGIAIWNSSGKGYFDRIAPLGPSQDIFFSNGGSFTNLATQSVSSSAIWYNNTFIFNSPTLNSTIPGVGSLQVSNSTYIGGQPGIIIFQNTGGSAVAIQIKNFRVNAYTSSVPVYTIGSEQSQPSSSNIQITLNSPVDTYNSSKNYLTTNGSVTSQSTLINVSVFTNISGSWVANQTNTSGINNTNYIFNITGIPDGFYKLSYQGCDNSSACNFSSNNTFTIDTTNPAINITYPLNTTYQSVSQLNYSVSDLHLNKCWYSLDGGGTNSSPSTCNNFTGLSSSEGLNHWVVYANDTLGNFNSSQVYFTKDSTPPYFTVIPANASLLYGQSLSVVFTAVDAAGHFGGYYVNDSRFNINSTGGLTNITNLDLGIYPLNITINDTLNNQNSTFYKVTVSDLENPKTYFYSPANNTYSSLFYNNLIFNQTDNYQLANSTVVVYPSSNFQNIFVSDSGWSSTLSGVDTCDTSHVCGWGVNFTYLGSSSVNLTSVNLVTGSGATTVYVQNATGQRLTTSSVSSLVATFSNITLVPGQSYEITANTPSNSYSRKYKTGTYPVLNGVINYTCRSWNTNKGTNNCDTSEYTTIYYLNLSSGLVNPTISISGTSNSTNWNYSFVQDGIYQYNANTCDTSGNCAFNSTNRTITIDTTNPVVTFNSATKSNNSYVSQNYIYANVSVTESNFANMTYNLYNQTSLVNSTTYLSLVPYINWTNLPSNTIYYYNVTVKDLVSHSGSSETRKITLDTTNPSTFYNPSTELDGSILGRNYALVNISTSDTNLNTTKLNWNGTNESFQSNDGINFWSNKTGLTDGIYTFYGWSNDTAGNYNLTSIRTINIDTSYPLINFVSPTSDNNTVKDSSNNWIYVNVSVIESTPKNITYSLYNSTSLVNQTTYLMSNQNSNTSLNWTNLPDSIYYYNVTINSIALSNSTETRQLTITTFRLFLDGIEGNNTVELGGTYNLLANSTSNISFCLDINNPDFGTNYSCGYGLNLSFALSQFRNLLFSNTNNYQTLIFNQTNSSNGESTFNVSNFTIPAHQYDYVNNLSINISGNLSNGNSTIYEPQIVIYRADNTSQIDRLFYGQLVGSNIYVNKVYDNPNYVNATNISFQDAGTIPIYLYLDKNAKIVSFLLNITGLSYGVNYDKNYFASNYSDIDTVLTDAQLDASGFIMPKNVSVVTGTYDDFNGGSIDTNKWVFGNTGSCPAAESTGLFTSSGMLRMCANSGIGTRYIQEYSSTNLTYYESNQINISFAMSYAGDYRGWGFSDSVGFLNGAVYSLPSPTGSSSCTSLSSTANIKAVLTKYNQTYWKKELYGSETYSNAQGSSCDTQTNYYNGNVSYVPIDTSVLNDFHFYVSTTSLSNYQSTTTLDVYNVTQMNYTRTNATVTSQSIYDSASEIPTATATFYGSGVGINNSLYTYLSADNGLHWESVTSGVSHNFNYPGNNLKWRVNFTVNGTLSPWQTNYIYRVNVTTVQSYPSNVTLDFGRDGIVDYSMTGELNNTNSPIQVNLTNALLTSAFSGNVYSGQTWRVPLDIHSDSWGMIQVNAINLTYDPNPVYLNTTSIMNQLKKLTNLGTLNLSIGAVNGTLNLTDLRYDYAGGNKTYTVLAHDSNYYLNKTMNLTYHFSQWDYNWRPSGVSWIYFTPSTPTSKNVSAYGQTSTLPLMNVTNLGYGGKNATLSMAINSTLSCVNLTMSLTGNKSNGIKLNGTFQDVSNMTYLQTINASFYADYNCNYNNWYTYNPSLFIRQCVVGGLCDTGMV